MTDRIEPSPEVRELLVEIAGDGAARLLRSRLPAEEVEIPVVGTAEPFLKKAERRLLEMHRDEVARLLYLFAVRVHLDGKHAAWRVHYRDARSAPDASELEWRSRGPLQELASAEPDACKLLSDCVGGMQNVRSTDLLTSSLRLAPAASTRVFLGLSLFVEQEDPDRARACLDGVLADRPSAYVASFALQNLAKVAADLGNHLDASDYYERAADADGDRLVPRIACLNEALLSGSEERSLRAATALEGVSETEGPLSWYVGHARAWTKSKPVVTSEVRELVRLVADKYGPAARRICNAFE